MDDPEKLRELMGIEANQWTKAQLEQVERDMDTIAALLLDLYQNRIRDQSADACGLADVDVPRTDR